MQAFQRWSALISGRTPHAGARGYVLKSDADQNLVAAVRSRQRGEPFLTSRVTELVLEKYLRQGDAGERDDPGVELTPREREIIQLVSEGSSSKEVAASLGISRKTVEAHRTNIMRKLRVRSVSELVRYAVRNRIVQA